MNDNRTAHWVELEKLIPVHGNGEVHLYRTQYPGKEMIRVEIHPHDFTGNKEYDGETPVQAVNAAVEDSFRVRPQLRECNR